MPKIVRFDHYEVDLSAGQLYKNGIKISLRDKSFQVLVSLIEHPGEIVPRDDLRRQLWPEDVFVDFDNNLNTAVARLREALSDSADHPRFIETLPKRGYRFLAPIFVSRSTAESSSGKRPRLLVLPFLNLSGDSTQEYFSDAMTDEMITELARVLPEQLAVIARTTAMCYKGCYKEVARIGRELGVDYVVEGSVHRTEEQLAINVQLIQVNDQTHLFAQKYKAHLRDISSVENSIAEAIAAHLHIPRLGDCMRAIDESAQVTPQRGPQSGVFRSVDPDVRDVALKGKATLEYATREAQVHQAIELFQKAIDGDPTYAPAWAGLGEALWYLAATGLEYVAPADVRDKAIAAAERALALDATLPDAHKARAVIAIDAEWDITRAQRLFERVLELRPGHAAAHNLYGQLLAAPLLRFDEARLHFDQARDLDPLSPWNDINLLGWWMLQGRPERTLEEAERACLRNPTVWTLHCLTGGAQLLLGRAAQAIPEFEAALKLLRPQRPSALLAPLGLAHGMARSRAEALKILAELEQTSRERYVSPFYLAVVNSGLGRLDEAFRLLEQALEQRTPYLVFCVTSDGNSVVLRRDPRWNPFSERLRRLVKLPAGSPNPYS